MAKQTDNALGSVRLSVCLSVCPGACADNLADADSAFIVETMS